MFGAAQQQQRTIPGAVATIGVNDRVAFLRKTYGHLAGAIFTFVALTYGFIHTETAGRFTVWALSDRLNWMIVLGAFMAIGWVTDRMARSEASASVQYLGLLLGVMAEAVIITPLLYVAAFYAKDPHIIAKAGLITLSIFGGLTATVFLTKKDFSFMRGILSIGTMAAFGVIIASWLFGFNTGSIFCVAMIALMGGYVLYQTSQLMAYFRPTQHVAASLMLFGTIATLFFYVLRFLMAMNRR